MNHSILVSAAALAAVFATSAPKGVTGKVVFEGEKPELKPLVVDPKLENECAPGDAQVNTTDPSLVIDKDGGLANVVLTVKVAGAKCEPAKPLVLDQKSCRFEPHVSVVTVGTPIEFANTDGVSHNVHTYPRKNETMNKMIPAGGKETQKYDLADVVEIKCDIHPWMSSYVVVTETPHFTVTAADGSFTLADLPAGEHEIEYWHEKLGKGKQKVTVKEDGTCEPVTIKMSAEKKAGARRKS